MIQPNEYDDSTSGWSKPFLIAVGGVFLLAVVSPILCLVLSRRHHRQFPSDVESAKRTPKEIIDLQTLNNANPSQKYKQAKGFMRQATEASIQSTEVCAICLNVLMDEDSVRRLKCKHLFHTSCIDSWLKKRHVKCPLCRSIFIPDRDRGPADVR